MKTALKLASCFGLKVDASIVHELSRIDNYSTLLEDLNNLVQDGLIDADTSSFRFVHDKVREAAYEMIDNRKRMHFEVGMALLSSFDTGQGMKDGTLFVILDTPSRPTTPNSTRLHSARRDIGIFHKLSQGNFKNDSQHIL